VKTIISIAEFLIYSLFPAAVAAQLVMVLRDIIPLLGIVLMRVGLYISIWFDKWWYVRQDNAALVESY